jgi:hypothetical protein
MEREHSPRQPGVFGTLVRHFFSRFFDTESLSPQGEPEAGVIQTLGILAAPGAFFVLLFRPLTLTGWNLVAVRYMFVSFSMTVMGFLMVYEWDALFPDRRDYQVLTPQPVRLSTLFLAKAAALAIGQRSALALPVAFVPPRAHLRLLQGHEAAHPDLRRAAP